MNDGLTRRRHYFHDAAKSSSLLHHIRTGARNISGFFAANELHTAPSIICESLTLSWVLSRSERLSFRERRQ